MILYPSQLTRKFPKLLFSTFQGRRSWQGELRSAGKGW